jgi:hypothetical protein
MNDYLGQLIQHYSQHGIIVDTNVLLLYFVGNSRHKRTSQYLPRDYDLLLKLLKRFQNRIVTTPNILTEVSNLLGNCTTSDQKKLWSVFASKVSVLGEKYLDSQRISQTPMFSKFGLTDSAIIELVKDKYLILTDDAMLFQYLEKNKIDVINFTHLRTSNLLAKFA